MEMSSGFKMEKELVICSNRNHLSQSPSNVIPQVLLHGSSLERRLWASPALPGHSLIHEPFIQPQLPRATITSHFINVTVLDEYSKEGHLREGWRKDGFPFSFFSGKLYC